MLLIHHVWKHGIQLDKCYNKTGVILPSLNTISTQHLASVNHMRRERIRIRHSLSQTRQRTAITALFSIPYNQLLIFTNYSLVMDLGIEKASLSRYHSDTADTIHSSLRYSKKQHCLDTNTYRIWKRLA